MSTLPQKDVGISPIPSNGNDCRQHSIFVLNALNIATQLTLSQRESTMPRKAYYLFLTAFINLLISGYSNAQSLILATDQPGTTFNTIGSGIALTVNKYSGLNLIVRPYSGPAAWAPLVDSGEVMFGALSANSAFQAFNGTETPPCKNLRLVRAGGTNLMLGFVVRRDSPIKTFSDLKGKRISSDFGGHLSIRNSLLASLKIAGYDWGDVIAVPVTGANGGLDALLADRLDATWASVGQPRAREVDAQIGIRYLSVPNTPEAGQKYQELVFAGARIKEAQPGAAPGIATPTRLLTYDAYLVTGKDTPDDVINQVLQTLWLGTHDLSLIHPSLKEFNRESSVTDTPVLPYHPAAVNFFKATGGWDAADQQRQEQLLSKVQ